MSVVVMKFGGTSVADATKIKSAARRAVAASRAGAQVVVVVSARGKKTDELVRLASEICDEPPPAEMDVLLATGEQESIALMAMAIESLGVPAASFTGNLLGIVTDGTHTRARIRSIDPSRIRTAFGEGRIVVAAGFQGVTDQGRTTTFGRGGSDLTAAALAAVLGADVCEIYTDVDGVYTTDPRVVPEARRIEQISYEEMLELASLGAGVMHSRAVEFAQKHKVPLQVRPAHSDGVGTLIAPPGQIDDSVVTGVALVKNEARVTLVELPDRPGVMNAVFASMAERKIPIDMVVQDVGVGGQAEVSFTVPESDLAATITAAELALRRLGAGRVVSGTNLSKVSAVGAGMPRHTGVAAEMFRALAEAGVNIELVTTSEIKVSVLVDRDDAVKAARAVHAAFGLDQPRHREPSVGVRQTETGVAAAAPAREQQIVRQLASMEDIVISEIRLDDEQARVTLSNLPDRPGIAADLFSAVAAGGVVVDMIVQNVSRSHRSNISFTVLRSDVDRCLLLTRAVLEEWQGAELQFEREIAKLSVTGIGLRTHTDVGRTMFQTLSGAGINVDLINTSEIRFSAIVTASAGRKAIELLENAFGIV